MADAAGLALVGYLELPEGEFVGASGVLKDWPGEVCLGRVKVTARWPTPRSFTSSYCMQVRVLAVDGKLYTGRSTGDGMLYIGRLSRAK